MGRLGGDRRGRAALMPGAGEFVFVEGNGLTGGGGVGRGGPVEVDEDGRGVGGRHGDGCGESRGEERAGGVAGDGDAGMFGVAALPGAVVIAVAAAAGGQFFLGPGHEQRGQQREAEGDQQQHDGGETPHPPIVSISRRD